MLENIRNFGLGFLQDLGGPSRLAAAGADIGEMSPMRDAPVDDKERPLKGPGGFLPKLTEDERKTRDLAIAALDGAGDALTPDFSNAPQVATEVNPFSPQQYQAMLAQMVQQQPGILERFRSGLGQGMTA
jgi:hypothetical protein